MRAVLTGRWARGHRTKSPVNSRLAANSLANKLPKTHSPRDTGKGDRSLSFLSKRDSVRIAGAPSSGKSTLARALYLDLQHECNLVPVLLDGRQLKGSSKDDLDRIVESS